MATCAPLTLGEREPLRNRAYVLLVRFLLLVSFPVLGAIQPPQTQMAFVTHIFRFRVLVQGIFRYLGRHLQMVQLRPSMREVATDAAHLTTSEWIWTSAHRMTHVGVTHGVVGREFNRRQVTRGDTAWLTQVTLQAEVVDPCPQQPGVYRNVGIVAPQTHPGSVREVRVQERLRLMTLKADDGLSRLENDVSRILPVFNAVAGSASPLDGGVDVIATGMVRMAFQAVRVLINPSRMRVGATYARAQQTGKHRAKGPSCD